MPVSFLLSEYKSAYSGLSRDSWLLAAVMLINRSGAMVIPFLSLYATNHLGFSLFQAGVLVAMFGAGSITGSMLGGFLVDRYGSYRIQLVALVSSGLFFFVLIPVTDFYVMAAGVYLLTVCSDMFRPANSASVAVYAKPENVARSFSLNRMAANLGFAVSPALGGVIATLDFRLIFLADGVTSLAAAFLFFKTFKNRSEPFPAGKKKLLGAAYRDAGYWFFVLLVILFAIAFFQLFSTIPVYYREAYKLPEFLIGLLLALNGAMVFIFEMILVNRLESKVKPARIIPVGIFLLMGSYLLLAFFNGIWVLVTAMILLSFAEMFAMPFMASWVHTRSSGNDLGSYMALYAIAYGVSLILAPIIGTTVAQWQGFQILWLVCIFILVIPLGLFFRLPERKTI